MRQILVDHETEEAARDPGQQVLFDQGVDRPGSRFGGMAAADEVVDDLRGAAHPDAVGLGQPLGDFVELLGDDLPQGFLVQGTHGDNLYSGEQRRGEMGCQGRADGFYQGPM